MSSLLSVDGLTKSYGGLIAVNDVSFQLEAGELLGLIGPNGSGKTTLINLITGTQKCTKGSIMFKGAEISEAPTYVRSGMGIARTFQIVKPLTSMTVWENVMVGATFGRKQGDISQAIATSLSIRHVRQCSTEVGAVLERVGLADKRHVPAEQLTLPDRKRLELGRALAMQPELLLLDEVMAGLNATEIEETMRLVQEINEEGITVICVEHVMKAIMSISKRILVLQEGRVIANGSPSEIVKNEAVIKAYLGTRYGQRDDSIAGA